MRPIDGDAIKRRAWDVSVEWRKQGKDYEALLLNGVVEQIVDTAPTLTPPNEPERAGLYGKYTVYKNKDGSLVTDCFILRPAKDLAAVAALRAYAAATDNEELAADIINWVGAGPNKPLTPCDVCRFSPPSSSDGKPCCMCPAERRPPERQEDTDA